MKHFEAASSTPPRRSIRKVLAISILALGAAISLGLCLGTQFPEFFAEIGERLGDGF